MGGGLRSIPVFLLGMAVACASVPVRPGSALKPWPDGDPHLPLAMFGFAVHVTERVPPERAEGAWREALGLEWPDAHVKSAADGATTGIGVELLNASEKGFPGNYVRSVGKGLGEPERALLEAPHRSHAVFVVLPVNEVALRLPAVLRATARVAEELSGVGDDLNARWFLSNAELRRRAAEGVVDGVPVVNEHIALHAYRLDDGSVRTVSVGMMKFGLPNVVVASHAPSNSRSMGALANLLLQSLVEGRKVGPGGTLELDLRAMKARALADAELGALRKGGTGRLVLTLGVGEREDGDDPGELVALTFARGDGELFVRQDRDLKTFFGVEDTVVFVDSSRAAEARARAMERLKSLAQGFDERLKDGERLLVKAPFKTDSGSTEWMWVEVLVWKGDEMRGVLENEPDDVAALKAGMRVTVSQDTLFDYLRVLPDGTEEGNTTAAFLEE